MFVSQTWIVHVWSLSLQIESVVAKQTKQAMRQFTRNDLNPRVLEAEYAVRGDLPIRAEELEKVILICYN